MTYDLVADIGGTNMRVAQIVDGVIATRRDFPMTKDRKVAETLRAVADTLDGTLDAVVAAGAGPVDDRRIYLTNGGWLVGEDDISEITGAKKVSVINDFEAAAWSLANLDETEVRPIGDTGPLTKGHRVAVGPGTGLGVGSLVWDGNRYRVVPGEGGHVAVGPRHASEVPIFEELCRLWPKTQLGTTMTLEAEAMLSGTGLPLLYQACGGEQDVKGREISERAEAGEENALRCMDLFRTHLAALAGNLAVTLNATGGLFLVGGVAQANPSLFNQTFWDVFKDGGREDFTKLRTTCGIYLVTIEDFGLRGCINALAHLDR